MPFGLTHTIRKTILYVTDNGSSLSVTIKTLNKSQYTFISLIFSKITYLVLAWILSDFLSLFYYYGLSGIFPLLQ